jgi:hypothetical protein
MKNIFLQEFEDCLGIVLVLKEVVEVVGNSAWEVIPS